MDGPAAKNSVIVEHVSLKAVLTNQESETSSPTFSIKTL